MSSRTRGLAALFCLFAAVACQKKEVDAAKADPPSRPAVAASAMPTDEEATQYAKSYIEALTKPNVPRAAQLIDWDVLLDKATADANVSEEWRRGFLKGAKEKGTISFVQQLSAALGKGADLSLLRVRTVKGEKHVVLRLLLPEGAVNYHEMPVVKDRANFVRATDVYVYAAAENFSDTIHRLYVMSASQNPTFLQSIAGKRNEFIEHVDDYKEMMQKVTADDGKGAIAAYNRLPESMKKDKAVMVAYVSASSKIGDDEAYGRAIDALRAAYPDDGGVDLMSIDGFFLKKRYKESLDAIDRLDTALGGDGYLDTLRASLYIQQGDLESARVHAARASESEPLLVETWWTQVTVALARKDFAETSHLLTHIQDELGVEIADLNTVPDYAEFVRSPEGKKWTAGRG